MNENYVEDLGLHVRDSKPAVCSTFFARNFEFCRFSVGSKCTLGSSSPFYQKCRKIEKDKTNSYSLQIMAIKKLIKDGAS